MKKTTDAPLWGLDDPDNVGASEYRAIYETLEDGLASFEDDGEVDETDIVRHAIGMLDEFIDHARYMRSHIRQTVRADKRRQQRGTNR